MNLRTYARRQCSAMNKIWVLAFRTGFTSSSAIYLCEFKQVLNLSKSHGLKLLGGLNESYIELGAWCTASTHVFVSVSSDFSAVVQKAFFECAGYRWKAQSIASKKWLRTDLYCLLLHLFFLFLESLQFLSLKEIVFGSSKQALAKWLFNPVQAYSALTIEMQIKTKRRYHF